MTCGTITMNQFLAALLGDRSFITVDQWEDIHNEYVSLRENKQSSYILDLIKEITYLQTKEFIIIKCVQVLAKVYSRELVMELKQCGCKGKFDFSNTAGYSADLKAALSFAKKYAGQIIRKEKDLKEYRDRHAGEVTDRKFFDSVAITLWRFMGSRVDYNTVTVLEWCNMMNEYDRHCEASQQNQSQEIAYDKKENVN